MLLCLALWFELGIQHEQSRCDLSLLETYNIEWRQILIKYQIYIITWQGLLFPISHTHLLSGVQAHIQMVCFKGGGKSLLA